MRDTTSSSELCTAHPQPAKEWRTSGPYRPVRIRVYADSWGALSPDEGGDCVPALTHSGEEGGKATPKVAALLLNLIDISSPVEPLALLKPVNVCCCF
ncbi:hypothetical protein GCM10009525_81280 [Streptosporangium amethystogenes subsp. fukuiense]